MSKPVVAAGLVVFRRVAKEIQYLMLQASYGDFHWSPPKGHVDKGETERQAALRETEEEAGITLDQLHLYEDFKDELHYVVRGKPKKVIYWLSELKNPEFSVKLSKEHKDMKWLNIEDAVEIAKYEDLRQTLKKAHSYISSLGS
ncbi:bis(5'-nucleosyl)-tetraphosphatase [asymmetrical]-like [Ruditapes philippinarum]|uniref:bis(5'-nucleosyl)-tetraphosphatase [asymmetrical]-like n=1 Tax=Ruditapes philippinarum TaxID=129788 RepID=UPI00295B78EE|nr:bis(5'-nucleosyl)-tetraphosphatase [asymmetrical]-like [Ruditapes philippinarum]